MTVPFAFALYNRSVNGLVTFTRQRLSTTPLRKANRQYYNAVTNVPVEYVRVLILERNKILVTVLCLNLDEVIRQRSSVTCVDLGRKGFLILMQRIRSNYGALCLEEILVDAMFALR